MLKLSEDITTLLLGGHYGKTKTYHTIRESYYWPSLLEDVKRYIRNCHTCRRSKAFRNAYSGGLQQLPVPQRPWSEIAVDFVVELPSSKWDKQSYQNIMVVTDRLTKWRYYIPCQSMDALTIARLFLRYIFSRHGLLDSITSDRGSQFTSALWKNLCSRLRIRRKMSTAFHPETDGQSKNSNQIMEQYLRAYCNYLQDD